MQAQRQAVVHHRRTEDGLRLSRAARLLSLLLRYEGDMEQAWEVGQEAVGVVETMPASHELALAYCNLSHLATASEDGEQARVLAASAAEVAAAIQDTEANIYAAINIGTIELIEGEGAERLERNLQLALDHGFEEHAGRAYVNLTWWSPRRRTYADVDRYFEPGLRYTEERGLALWHSYLLAYRARAELDRGNWDEAATLAGTILRNPGTSPVPRIVALAVLGLIRARRGDPEVWEPLDEAWALAQHTGELQRLEPAAMARAEACWLEGRPEGVRDATALVLELAMAVDAAWVVGEMLLWRKRAGARDGGCQLVPEPFASELSGDWKRAAKHWGALDSPYEVGLALAEADDEDALGAGFGSLQRLGARPAAAITARRLRERGARGLREGPGQAPVGTPPT